MPVACFILGVDMRVVPLVLKSFVKVGFRLAVALAAYAAVMVFVLPLAIQQMQRYAKTNDPALAGRVVAVHVPYGRCIKGEDYRYIMHCMTEEARGHLAAFGR